MRRTITRTMVPTLLLGVGAGLGAATQHGGGKPRVKDPSVETYEHPATARRAWGWTVPITTATGIRICW